MSGPQEPDSAQPSPGQQPDPGHEQPTGHGPAAGGAEPSNTPSPWQSPASGSEQPTTEVPSWQPPPAYPPPQYPQYPQPGTEYAAPAYPPQYPATGQFGQQAPTEYVPAAYPQHDPYGQQPGQASPYGQQPGQYGQYGQYPLQPGQYGQPGPDSPYNAPGTQQRSNRSLKIIGGVVGALAVVIIAAVGVLGFWKPGFFVTTRLDVNKAQAGVQQVLTDETNGYGAKNVKDVTCNNGQSPKVKKGDTFNCVVSIDGTQKQVTVTFQDDSGTYEVGRPR
jgi:Domain of unknown function (DUF4333)